MKISGHRRISIIIGGYFMTAVLTCLSGCTAKQNAPVTGSLSQFTFQSLTRTMSDRECDVWGREKSFASSVDHHDALEFSRHVSNDAVFISDAANPTRGREAIVREWSTFIVGDAIRIHWYPGSVEIAGDEKVALSHGFYWVEKGTPTAVKRYSIGHFISVWSEESDGIWRVLFDGGNTDRPLPADETDIQRLVASFPDACPRTGT